MPARNPSKPVDPRYRAAKPTPSLPLPATPTARMVDAAVIAASQATGGQGLRDRCDGKVGEAALYAFRALNALFPDAGAVARKMGVTSQARLIKGAEALPSLSFYSPAVAAHVAAQLDRAVERWRTEEKASRDKRVVKEAERAQARRAAAAQARRAAQEAADAEARADHARREAIKAAEDEARRQALKKLHTGFVPRVYTRMPKPESPGRGLVTAKPRADWWNGAEASRRDRRGVAVADPSLPPPGRSALDQRQRGEG